MGIVKLRDKINELNNLRKEIEEIFDFCDNKIEDLLKELDKLENEVK